MQAPSIQELVEIPLVWDRMSTVEARLFEATESDDPFLTKVAQHLLVAGGKRFRPLLAQLASELGPAKDRRAVEAGVAVELIHVGSLYHDDVIDEAMTRRGEPSGNAIWGDSLAIMAGDYLLAKASEVAARHLGNESVVLLATTYAELVQGQTLELQLDGDLSHGPDDYFRVIGGKTASLIRTSARIGALAGDAPRSSVEALSTWAWELGIVFQITDDALDLVATDDFLGKPAGSDTREGKYTLPLLYALQSEQGDDLRRLLATKPPHPQETVDEVIDILRLGGWVDRALDEAARRIHASEAALEEVPESATKPVLQRLGQFLLDQVVAARA